MHARARTAATRWLVCCGNRYSVALPDTRMSMTPSACGTIRRCAGSSAAKPSWAVRLRRARLAALRRNGLLQNAGDAGADQGLVADEPEGQADQDRREGGEPRPLCYLPDGRGRHRTANVPRDFAAHRGATAAATTSASVRRSMSCIQEQPTEGVRPNARENGQIRP